MDSISPNDGRLPALLDRLFDEPIERFTLPNGLTVILKEDFSNKLSSVQLWVKTGSLHEGPMLGSGLSHFLEHMLFKGTPTRPGGEMSRQVQAAGGGVNAYTTFDRTVYYIDGLSEQTELAVELLADAAFNSVLSEEDTAKERDVILREIDMGLDDPDRQVSRALFEAAYREHPYRQPVIGHRELFEKVTREQLFDYYKIRYVPDNMTLVVVGHIDTPALREAIEKHFGPASRGGGVNPFVPVEPRQLAMREDNRYGDVNICRGGLAFKIPGLEHVDAPGLDLLASILGVGHSSIFWRQLRDEKKLVHHIDTSCWNPGSGGLFWVSYVCDPEKRAAVHEAILIEVQKAAREGIGENQLRKARRQALAGEINTRKTMSGQASRLGLAEVVVGDLGYPRRYFSRLNNVEPRILEELAGRYLVADGLTAVSLNSTPPTPTSTRLKGISRENENFQERTLGNGARLIFQRDSRHPKINLRLVALGGPLYEEPHLRGITALLATLLIRDSIKRCASEVAELIEGVGGSMSEFAGNNSFGLGFETMSGDTEILLDLFEQALLASNFQQETFELEREAQIASIKEDEDEIVSFGKKRLRQLFFGDHPFHIDAYGVEKTLNTIGLSELERLRSKLLVGSNVVVSVVGDFQPDLLLPSIEEVLEKLPSGPFAPSKIVFDEPKKSDCFEEILPRQQAVVFQAYPDSGVKGKDFYHGELLSELFSEMSGRLFTRVRDERGMAYFVGANRITGIHNGMFYLCAGTRPDCCPEMNSEFDAEISRVVAGEVGEEELLRCQTRLKAAKRMGLQTIGARGMRAALNTLYGLKVNDWEDYDKRIDSIDVHDLAVFARSRLAPEKCVGLIVKP